MGVRASNRLIAAPSLRGVIAAGLGFFAAACASVPTGPLSPPPTDPRPDPMALPVAIDPPVYTPPHMAEMDDIFRVGLLLPFSASNAGARAEAQNLLRAAELAVFERAGANVLLLLKDTQGTPEGAQTAARAALTDGADVILGPLFGPAVRAAAEPARAAGVPVIAFSTDPEAAGDGVYLLSFPPAEDVRRVVEYARAQGTERFAFIGPDDPYGRLTAQAYRSTVAASGATLVAEAFYYSDEVNEIRRAARELGALGPQRVDALAASAMTGLDWEPGANQPFQTVILPAGGDALRLLGPLLIYENIDPLAIKFLGTSLWADPETAREPALQTGWFAGPDPEARVRFEQAFEAVFEREPSRLASLGYDGAALAALMARGGEADLEAFIETPDGYLGVDGLFRFRPDGSLERGLAVYSVRNGAFVVIDPAPQTFTGRLDDPGMASEPVEPARSARP